MPPIHVRDLIESRWPALLWLWKRWKGRALSRVSMTDTFSRIHHHNVWGDSESVSGAGSTLSSTRVVRNQLPHLIRRLGVRTVLDIPCGDFNWMRRVPLDVDLYVGADVVPSLIEANRRFANASRRFLALDLTADPLPRVDLILCRDCLIHFSYSDINKALDNIEASGAEFLLTTTYTSDRRRNIDIVTGQWRPLNLCKPPFNLSRPLITLDDSFERAGRLYDDKSLGLWRIREIQAARSRQRAGNAT